MGNPAKFSALNTKLKAMSAQFLTASDYEELLKLSTEREIARYLKNNTRYKKIFEPYNIENLKRWEIELLIQREIVLELNKIRGYLDENYREFIDVILLRYEIKDLKLVLRAVSRNEDLKEIKEHFAHDREHEVIDFDKLLSKNNLNDMAAQFKGTVFQDSFRSITEEDLNLREFHVEMNLDSTFYKLLKESAQKMDPQDKRLVELTASANIDLINVQWILRAKKYYNLMDEELLNYTLLGGNISFKKLKEIIYAPDYLERIKKIGAKHGFYFDENHDEYLQTDINRNLQKMMKKVAREYPLSIAELILFTHKLEFETMDLISIIEGVRYNFSEMQRLLIEGGD